MLLAHIRDAFGGAQRIHTETLLEALVEREDGPWALMWGKDLQNNNTRGPAARLSRMLRDFEVKSKDVRAGEDSRNKKGYERADFEDAWARYLPSMGKARPSTRLPYRGRYKGYRGYTAGGGDQGRSVRNVCSVPLRRGDARELSRHHPRRLPQCRARLRRGTRPT